MLARCKTAALQGLEARPVLVEVDLAPGLPGLQMVGLADAAVQEARERVRSALRHSGLKVPLTRVVVNLAPLPWACWWPVASWLGSGAKGYGVPGNWASMEH